MCWGVEGVWAWSGEAMQGSADVLRYVKGCGGAEGCAGLWRHSAPVLWCLLTGIWVMKPRPLCDIPSGCCSFTGPWTVTRSSLHMLRRVATFCRQLRPVLLLVSFPRSRSPVVGVLGLCWVWHGVPFACQRRPIVGVLSPPPPPPRLQVLSCVPH